MIPSPPSQSEKDVFLNSIRKAVLNSIPSNVQDNLNLELTVHSRSQGENNCGFHVCEFMRKEAEKKNNLKYTIYDGDDTHIREQVFLNIIFGRFLNASEMKKELNNIVTNSKNIQAWIDLYDSVEFSDATYATNVKNDFFSEKNASLIEFLTPGKYANDVIIDRYVDLCNTFTTKKIDNKTEIEGNAYFYNTFYSSKLTEVRLSPNLKTLRKVIKHKSLKYHYIPINITNFHWLLVCIEMNTNETTSIKIQLYDSCFMPTLYMEQKAGKDNTQKIIGKFLSVLFSSAS